jgi:hypothetical protein
VLQAADEGSQVANLVRRIEGVARMRKLSKYVYKRIGAAVVEERAAVGRAS